MKRRITAIIMAFAMIATTAAFVAPIVIAEGNPALEDCLPDEYSADEQPPDKLPEEILPGEDLEDGFEVQEDEDSEDSKDDLGDDVYLPQIQEPQIQAVNQQNSPIEISNYADFVTAVINAQYGDTLIITGVIEVPPAVNWSAGNNITLRRGIPEARFIFTHAIGTPETIMGNFTFDGANLLSDVPFVHVTHNARFDGTNFINSSNRGFAGAVSVFDANVSFISSRFDNNTAGHSGAHLEASSANVNIYNSTFTNGRAGMNGGAIQNNSVMSITSTTITGNTAEGSGGGISSTGALTVTNSRIYANTAKQGGADIASGIWATLTLSDSLEVLTSIFADSGLVPIGWARLTYHNSRQRGSPAIYPAKNGICGRTRNNHDY